MSRRGVQERVDDIAEAIARIREAETLLDRAEAADDERASNVAYDAILYRLLVIGEATKTLPASAQQACPDVPWRNIGRMRDRLAHQYHRIDPQIVRATLDQPLTELQAALPLMRQHHLDE